MNENDEEVYEHLYIGTGVDGVNFKEGKTSYYYQCKWKEIDNKTEKLKERSKRFNVVETGRKEAFRLAVEYRKEMEKLHMENGEWISPA